MITPSIETRPHTISPYFSRLARIELNRLGLIFLVLAANTEHKATAVDLVARQQSDLGALTAALADELDLRDRLIVAGQAMAQGDDGTAWELLMAELGYGPTTMTLAEAQPGLAAEIGGAA